ncbi:hypothetical protein AB0E88_00720 [Streptomyces sp. NPDC028635]|uniref:hypothetical protein n=1 Tax=Streptomyces sp. NPDC028635 TaxID=3154800 RepID=UPI0033EA8F77
MVRPAHSSRRPAPFRSELHTLEGLLHAGHPHRAAARSAALLRRAARQGCPGWTAEFGALRAEALLSLGDLTACEHQAAAALRAAGPLGSPRRVRPAAVLAEALTAQGRLAEAAHHLAQDAPDGDPADPSPARHLAPVLAYLRAQGRHHLAGHRHQDALAAFERLGGIARRHAPAGPSAHGWRTGAAEALLGLGRPKRAGELLAELLAEPGPIAPRVHGAALRLYAETQLPAHRPATLGQAVALLRASGDRVELARAYADLGRALSLLDDPGAAALLRRAAHLAADCGAVDPCRSPDGVRATVPALH